MLRKGAISVNYFDSNFSIELKRRNVFADSSFPLDWEAFKKNIDSKTQVANKTESSKSSKPDDTPILPGQNSDFNRARDILRNSPKEAMVVCEVVPVLIPVGSLFLPHEYDAIPDAQ